MKILIAYSKDDNKIYENCKFTIERTSTHWTLDHYIVDESDSAEPDEKTKQKLKQIDYFVLIHTRRVANNYFGNGEQVRNLLRDGCKAVAYRVENSRRPSSFDNFDHLEGLIQLENYFKKEYEENKNTLSSKSRDDKISSLFDANLSDDGLVYLSYYYYTTQILSRDLFKVHNDGGILAKAGKISAFMKAKQFTPETLRDVYGNIFENCLENEVHIEKLLGTAKQGDLVRAVFDVRTGAFYINETVGSHYVCGATINQYRVYELDEVMKKVCEEVERIESSPH